MARRLGAEKNELRLKDNLSGSDIVLFYRMPDTKERAGYANERFVRRGKKVNDRSTETRLKYGAKVLTGFKDGCFEVKKDGKWVPISCEKDSPQYYPDWKTFVEQSASDLIELLAIRVFELPVQITPGDAAAGIDDIREALEMISGYLDETKDAFVAYLEEKRNVRGDDAQAVLDALADALAEEDADQD